SGRNRPRHRIACEVCADRHNGLRCRPATSRSTRHRKPLMRSPACWTALLLPLMALPAAAADDLPWNVVLIVADDLGWSDLACYGNTLHQTPHLDQLARQGVRFSDAYAASP